MRIFFPPSLLFYMPCIFYMLVPPLLYDPKGNSIFFVCVFYQHIEILHQQLTVVTLGSIISSIQVSPHLVYKNPLQCWDNVNGPHCKWKSSLCFYIFLQKFCVYSPVENETEKSWQKMWSVSSLRKECLENLCYQSFIVVHKLDLRSIYWIQ